MQKFPELAIPLEFNQYCELFEKLLNTDNDRLMRIAFDVYDYNQDKTVCELDTYTMMQQFADDDKVFVYALSNDLCVISQAL